MITLQLFRVTSKQFFYGTSQSKLLVFTTIIGRSVWVSLIILQGVFLNYFKYSDTFPFFVNFRNPTKHLLLTLVMPQYFPTFYQILQFYLWNNWLSLVQIILHTATWTLLCFAFWATEKYGHLKLPRVVFKIADFYHAKICDSRNKPLSQIEYRNCWQVSRKICFKPILFVFLTNWVKC